MPELAPSGAMHAWRARHSFESVWRVDHWDKDERERVLRFWLRAAREDEWTFQELRRFIGMDDRRGPAPARATLQSWANEVAAGRRVFEPPRRTGPKTDHRPRLRDAHWRSDRDGVVQAGRGAALVARRELAKLLPLQPVDRARCRQARQ